MEFDATFLISVISFIAFVFIMNKIFYAPILEIMQKRQDFVENNFESAAKTKNQIQEKETFINEELEKSRDKARTMISQHAQNLKQERSKKIAKYKEEQYGSITQERNSLKNSAIEAKETLKDNVVDIAKEISEKILGNSVSTDTIEKSQIKEQG